MTTSKKPFHSHWLFQGFILALLSTLIDGLAGFNFLKLIWKILLDLWVVLSKPYALPLGAWLLVGIVIIFLVWLVLFLNSHTGIKEVNLPEFYNFRTLELEGVAYRWKWSSTPNGWNEEDLIAYCPSDNCMLLPQNGGYYNPLNFYCPVCSKRYTIKPLEEVKVLIRHRIDNKVF